MTELQAYQEILSDCRFCPMCKPAAEVANRVKIEGYSTRSRAMMLWRIASGRRGWTPRSAELLYQSTLDGISEAFCVSDRPVSAYTLAARQDVWAAGLAPAPVREALAAVAPAPATTTGERVLVAAECADAGWSEHASALAARLGLDVVVAPVGATAYALGAVDVALEQAQAAGRALQGATIVVADGPQTLWMLQRIWAELGVELGAEVRSLPAYAVDETDEAPSSVLGEAYVVDSRAAAYLADRLALPVAIQPGYIGEDPDDWGRGPVYSDLRALLRHLGGTEQRHRWERSLARSSGADDGLWATYPDLASDLAVACLEQASAAGARASRDRLRAGGLDAPAGRR